MSASPTQAGPPIEDDDEKRLAELGYKQELRRKWSGFSNFAISFSIISILAGCFTTFGQAWMNGGPIAISWGWPLISIFILIIGFCMSELVSAYPTAGGIYWWAARMGKPVHGWFTGWLNLVGLVAVTASVDYGCATFMSLVLDAYTDWDGGNLNLTFLLFVVILAAHVAINIWGHNIIDVLQNVSVWWHVAGAAAVVLILVFVPEKHQSLSFVFTERFNNSGYSDGTYWFLVLPFGFLLTQYTITGFDACAHVSEETKGASKAAAKGLWQSIFYSAIGGWILLLSFLFAVQDQSAVGGSVQNIFHQALDSKVGGLVMVISAAGQFFCTVACMTSTSRMLYAFSRDGAVPGSQYWSRLSRNRVPVYGVVLSTVVALVLTLPALVKVDIGGFPTPVAFFAVVSIGVLGLYIAFAIPIWLRWRAGDSFQSGNWTLGPRYRWMCVVAVLEIAVTSIVAMLPTSSLGAPWYDGFAWKYVNYAILVVPGALVLLWVWWHASVKNWFRGPKMTIDLPTGVTSADEIALEHQGASYHHPEQPEPEPSD
jgi:amino acid transporter